MTEAGEDVDCAEFDAYHGMVSFSVGHYATDDEVAGYLKSRMGSRAMSGMRGDLLSMETWLKHFSMHGDSAVSAERLQALKQERTIVA